MTHHLRRLLVCASLVDLSANVPTTILPMMMLGHGYSAALIASVLFVPLAIGLVTTLPSGNIVDAAGVRVAIRLSVAGLALTTYALFAARSPAAIGTILAIRAACGVLFMTASFVCAASSADAKERLYGVTWLALAVTVSFCIGPALGTFLWQHGIHEIQFLACAAICAAALAFVPNTGAHRAEGNADVEAPVAVPYAAWLPTLLFCVAVSAIGGVNTTLAIVGLHARMLNGGLFFSATAIGMLLGRIPSARIVARYGPVAAATALAVLILIGGAIVAAARSNAAVIAGAICMGAAWTAMLPACTTLLLAKARPEMRGRVMAAYTFAMSLGGVIGGAEATRFASLPNGYALALLLACSLPTLALVYLAFAERRLRQPKVVTSERSMPSLILR